MIGQEPAAAHRYAQAFVNLASRSGQLDPCLKDLAAIQELLVAQPLLNRLLTNPEIAVEEKSTLLTRLLGDRATPLTLRLLTLLLWKGRLPALPAILAEASRLRDQIAGIARGTLRSAHPLSPTLVTRLSQRLNRRLGKHVELTTAVDPGLLGGVVVQLEHLVIDGSVRQALELLRDRLSTLKLS